MARLIAAASGNFSTSATWGSADTSALVSNSAGNTALTTSSQNSANFVPGAITVDAIALRVASRAAGTPTNTLTIVLYDVTSSSALATVNVPVADIPETGTGTGDNGGWVLFSLGAPVALAAGNNHQVRLSVNNTSTALAFLTNGTAANWQHLLRQTTGAAPAATDDLFILGLWTGSATWTTYAVTMDVTTTSTTYGSNPGASTIDKAAGGIFIGRGSLAWANTTSSTFALKVAGPVIVSAYGTLSLGTDAAPCDRSTIMELQFATTAGYGIISLNQPDATVTLVGQSRTAGKAVSQCLLTANTTASVTTTLSVDADTGWKNGDVLWVSSTRPAVGEDAAPYTLNGDATSGSIALTGAVSANYGSTVMPASVVLRTRSVKVTSDNAFRGMYHRQYGKSVWTVKWAAFVWGQVDITPTVAGGAATWDHVISDNDSAFIVSTVGIGQGSAIPGNTISLTNVTLIDASGAGYAYNIAPAANSTLTGVTVTDLVVIVDGSGGYGGVPIANLARFERIKQYGSSTYIGWAPLSGAGVPVVGQVGGSVWICGQPSYAFLFPNNFDGFEDFTFDGTRLGGSYCMNAVAGRNVRFTNGWMLPDLYVINVLNTDSFHVAFENCRMGGWASRTPAGLINSAFADKKYLKVELQGCDFSTASPFVQFDGRLINFGTTGRSGQTTVFQVSFVDCLGAADLGDFTGITTTSTCAFSQDSYVSFNNYNRTSGSHKLYRPYANMGLLVTDATTYRTAAPSERIRPNRATRKLESSPKRYAVGAGETATVSTFVNVDGTYDGSAPRLRVRANAAAGFNGDTTLATHGLTTGSFIELSSGFSVPDDTVIEVFVDCDGTTGSIYVDDWSVT